jgi:hypothetical protein
MIYNKLLRNFERRLSCNLALNDNYIIKEIVVKYNKKMKYFYEEEENNLLKTNKVKLDKFEICKTCKGFGWIIDNSFKDNLEYLPNQLNIKICPDCN